MIGNGRLLALIAARGGSERLPRKNVLKLAGKSLIVWSIEAGLRSKYVDRVIVSTDDEEIAEISRYYGADVPFMRPIELSRDTTSSMDVIRHSIRTLEKNGDRYEYLLLLQPTSPLRTEHHIDEAVKFLIEKAADGVIGVTETEHPVEWANKLPKSLSMDGFISEENQGKPYQDFPQRYRINGAIYLYKVSAIMMRDGIFFKEGSYAYKMDQMDSIDIDTQEDFLIAEALMEHSQNSKLESS